MKRSLIGIGLALVLTLSACGSTPEGRANKAAGKQVSPAAGRIIAKSHHGKAYWFLIRNKGKSRTIYVTARAFDKCHVDRWYSKGTCQ